MPTQSQHHHAPQLPAFSSDRINLRRARPAAYYAQLFHEVTAKEKILRCPWLHEEDLQRSNDPPTHKREQTAKGTVLEMRSDFDPTSPAPKLSHSRRSRQPKHF